MNDPVDIIQTILLVSLIVLLAAILYKKLLRKLGNDPSKPKFLNLEQLEYDQAREMLVLSVDAPKPTEIEVYISGPQMDRKQLIKRSLDGGGHVEELSVGNLRSGKFEIEILTGQQRISKYLIVD